MNEHAAERWQRDGPDRDGRAGHGRGAQQEQPHCRGAHGGAGRGAAAKEELRQHASERRRRAARRPPPYECSAAAHDDAQLASRYDAHHDGVEPMGEAERGDAGGEQGVHASAAQQRVE